MSNSSSVVTACYLYNEDDPESWGDCCEDYGLVPKPIWVLFLITVPIEFVVANSLTVSTGELFEKKEGKEAWFFIGFNLLTLALILGEFDWSSCEGDGFGCYQGLLFLFYNSTAAITSLTLWMLVVIRKFFPHLISLLLIAVGPIAWLFDTFCDDQSIFNVDTGLFSWNKEIITKARDTKMFWYHHMALTIMVGFGGATHFIPMTFGAYIYISVFLLLMMLISHTYRLRSIDIWQKQKGPRDQKKHTRALIGAMGIYAISPVIVAVLLVTSPFRWLLFVWSKYKLKAEPGEVLEEVLEADFEEGTADEDVVSLASSEDEFVPIPEPKKAKEEERKKEKKGAERKKMSKPKPKPTKDKQQAFGAVEEEIRAGQAAPTAAAAPVPPGALPPVDFRRRTSEVFVPTHVEPEEKPIEAEKEEEEEEEEKKVSKRAKRNQMIKYILDILKKLCLYDPLDRVIVFAGATILILFTTNVNYGILFYSGAPYIEAPYLDFIARDTNRWFECTRDSFTNFSALGMVDFIGLGITAFGVFFQLPTILQLLLDQ